MAQREPLRDIQGWVGHGIEEVRIAAGLTQPELADKIEVSAQTVWNLEHGVTRAKEEVVSKIAQRCAGMGWLPADPDGIEDYIWGYRATLPLEMRRTPRPRLRLVEPDSEAILSTPTDSDIPGYDNAPLAA